MRWGLWVALAVVAIVAVYLVRGEGVSTGSVAGFVGFLGGLVAGGVGGMAAASLFCWEDAHTERTKITLAWVSCAGIVTLAFAPVFALDLTEREGLMGQVGRGAIQAFIGFFWLVVLEGTLWKTRGRAWARKFAEWLAMSASASLAGITVAALLERYVLSSLTRGLAG